jgi:biopolymer transport protein TolR
VKSQLKDQQDAVFLRCDETVPFGIFASVVDALRVSGINNISIVTEPITDRPRGK